MAEQDTESRCRVSDAVISGLSEYHLKKHLQGQKHKSRVIQSKQTSIRLPVSPSSTRAPVSSRNGSELEVRRHNNLPKTSRFFRSSIVMHASGLAVKLILTTGWLARKPSCPGQVQCIILCCLSTAKNTSFQHKG